jgi:hypothetical protein
LAEYSQGSVALCRVRGFFTRGAFTLKKYFSRFLPFGPLDQLRWCLPQSGKDDDNEHEDEGGAHGFLDFGGGAGGIEDYLGEGCIARFYDWGIYDTYLANQSAVAPDPALSSSSSIMVGGLLTIFCICSAFALNLSPYLSAPLSIAPSSTP